MGDADPRTLEAARLAVEERKPSAWQRLCPTDAWRDPILQVLEAHLDAPETRAQLDRHEAEGSYPAPVLDRLRELGLAELLVGRPGDPSRATAWHLCALNAVTARRDGSIAITVGVNTLALLSAYVAATPEQLDAIACRVREGAFSSMLLTELPHGSNLLRNQARAESGTLDERGRFVPGGGTHYRLNGVKDLINGGIHHDLLFAFLRTRHPDRYDGTSEVNPLEARGDFTFFWLERQAGVEPLSRWRTLPTRAADISGVRFRDVVVSADRVLGRPNGGFSVAQKTLILSRGGIAALASGCVSQAGDLARRYARRRNVYGHPIAGLGAIAQHLIRLEALELVTAAVSLKATACLNAWGLSAAHYTAAAKATACAFAEEGVAEGRQVLGGRALLEELPYARLIRDVLLYGVFDGTRHVMLQELSSRLGQEAVRAGRGAGRTEDPLETVAAVYARPPQPVVEALRAHRPPRVIPLDRHLDALAALEGELGLQPLARLAGGLFAQVRALRTSGRWADDQGLKLEAARLFAELEALAALVEVADPDRRPQLGLPPTTAADPDRDRQLYVFACGWLGGRILADLRRLARGGGLKDDEWGAGRLAGAENGLHEPYAEARLALLDGHAPG